MPKRTIEIPERLAEFGEAMEKALRELERFEALAAKEDGAADFAAFSRALGEHLDEAQLAAKRRALQGLDLDVPRILIDGKAYARVGRYDAEYFAKEGPVTVTRSLYRECGARNARTVDAVSLRSGALNGWLPEAAKPAAFLLQQGTSREAEATARALGVLPYSRSSFERVGHEVAELHAVVRDVVEDKLINAYVVPKKARSVSLSLDRVAVPMEEPRPRPVGRPRADAPKNPVDRVWHMAFVATLTLNDETGAALHTLRYGRMPELGAAEVLDSMRADLKVLLGRRPLEVVLLCDGAQELVDLLDNTFNQASLGVRVHRLVDFWHVAEKLGAAATIVFGAAASGALHRWKALLLNCKSARTRILNELHGSGKREVRVGNERPVHAAITYLENQGDRMGYVEARALGLPVGSGNVEATCKSLVGQRMVRTGSRWKESTGQHILDLRALALSDRFDAAIDLTLAPLVHRVRRMAA
ncbi:MAG: ISKra4 family transposase [Myxococcales bacterium]|nr:ISKra4 family transposase [Myxococcales bacterium]